VVSPPRHKGTKERIGRGHKNRNPRISRITRIEKEFNKGHREAQRDTEKKAEVGRKKVEENGFPLSRE
jgi:hypothetical protein